MAVVRSLEGTFYDIPDSELEQYKVPADQVKGLMEAAGQRPPQNPGPQTGRQGQGRARARPGPGGYGWIAADPCPVHNARGRRQGPAARGRRRPAEAASRGAGGRRRGERRASMVLDKLGKLGKLV